MRELARDLSIVIRKEVREQRAKLALLGGIAALTFLWLANLVVILRHFERSAVSGGDALVMNMLFTHQALSIAAICSFMVVVSLYYKEKKARTLEYLLVTPLSPARIWLGKSLFMSLCGLVAAYVVVLIGLVTLNVFTDGTDVLLPNPPALFFFVAVLPALCFAISAFLGLIHLTTSGPTVSNFIFLIAVVAYLGVTSARVRQLEVTWGSTGGYATTTLLVLAVVLVLSRRLTRERLILSDI